jgi:hypothetical protein
MNSSGLLTCKRVTRIAVHNLEQLLEHAIVHLLRHRRQIEKFMLQGKIAARSDG